MKTPEQYIVEAFAKAKLNGLRILRVTECKDGKCLPAFVVYRDKISPDTRLGRRQDPKALFEFVSKLTRFEASAAP